MTKLAWRGQQAVEVVGFRVHVGEGAMFGEAGGATLALNTRAARQFKSMVWPVYKAVTDLLFDGFIEQFARRMLVRYLNPSDIFLEVACGDTSVADYVPAKTWYNAFDFRLTDFHLERLLARRERANIALANVEAIPLEDKSVDVMVCLQAFIHFPDFDKAAMEMARIARTGARLICSISNNFATLYKIRGPHPDFTHDWSYQGFINDMARFDFRLVHGEMCGVWVPLPGWLTQRTFTLPIRGRTESDNTIFLYVFEKQ